MILERYYCTRNRSGFARALEDAKLRAHAAGVDWQVVRRLGADEYHSVSPASESIEAGYVVSCTVTAIGEVLDRDNEVSRRDANR